MSEPSTLLSVSEALLEKYNTTGPRYTSYPTAPVWKESYTARQHAEVIEKTNALRNAGTQPLSLYVHLPFCEARCLFCGCNVVITQQREQAEKYLEFLFHEIEMVAERMNRQRPVVQFHWGGGTPTYLSPEQIDRLFRFQKEAFGLLPDAEVAIEVDPRVTSFEQVQLLKELGFNRISMGVQDFEPTVQASVNRIQPFDLTERFLNFCRAQGFEDGINLDLIYGLPNQTVASFTKTLDDVIRLSPDRIALYNFAYVPWLSPHQKEIAEETLPAGRVKFQIFRMALNRLTEAGYRYIGMDHFAKPKDELSVALDNGTLHRNFMGYTVKNKTTQNEHDPDLYGFGVSAISGFQRQYAQNVKKLSQYYEAIQNHELPVHRGVVLNDEDLLRRQIILDILCLGVIDYAVYKDRFDVNFQRHFDKALSAIAPMEEDGLLTFRDSGFSLTPLGRIFSRNIAMPFDAYLEAQRQSDKPTFSKTL